MYQILFNKAIYKNLKICYSFILWLYANLLLPLSLIFLICLKIYFYYFPKKYKKLISLRISKNYFGHYAIEPAIASSIKKENCSTKIIVSFKSANIRNNKKLNYCIKESFPISRDIYLKFMEHIYNYSEKKLKRYIKKYYEPLIPKFNLHREMKYWPYLLKEKDFTWREYANKIIKENQILQTEKAIIIALRTEDFHKNSRKVQSQPYRNADLADWIHVVDCCLLEKKDREILCYCHKNIGFPLESRYHSISNIRIINQDNIDILDILKKDALLISNANGIGSASFAIGLKTLYIQHSPWHVWFTSHSNSLMLPIEYFVNGEIEKRSLDKNFSLAFSPLNDVPFNFERNFSPKGINLQSIKNIKKDILISSIREALNLEENSSSFNENLLGCSYNYRNPAEKIFWQIYIKKLPFSIRYWHKNITMKVSTSFLKDF